MKRVVATIQIAAAPMAVWAVLTDLSRYRKWHPLFPEASGQIAVGNRIMLHNMAPSGRVRTVRPRILVVEPGVELTWKATIPGLMGGTHRFELSPVGNGTRLVQSETFHGIPLGVPHTRPLGVTAHATRSELVDADRALPNQLQVPGSISALLEFRFGQAGRDAAGFAVHVPHYLAQAAYPAGAVRLLESVTGLTGLSVPDESLREAARRTDAEINRQVEASAEVTDVVQALEQQYDAAAEAQPEPGLLVDPENMPTAEELGEQFERFLAEQQGPGNPQDL